MHMHMHMHMHTHMHMDTHMHMHMHMDTHRTDCRTWLTCVPHWPSAPYGRSKGVYEKISWN